MKERLANKYTTDDAYRSQAKAAMKEKYNTDKTSNYKKHASQK